MNAPAKKMPWKRCAWHGCRNLVNPKNHQNKCPRCQSRWLKKHHPLKYYFGKLRRRAKERGKDFSLTFEQYRTFCLNTDYHKLKGKSSISLSIDRKDDKQGYHAWNIQAISLRENTRKQYVPFFAKQSANTNYEPSPEELEEIQRAIDAEN